MAIRQRDFEKALDLNARPSKSSNQLRMETGSWNRCFKTANGF